MWYITVRMKITRITILLFLIFSKVCGQSNPFTADKNKDSVWIKELIEMQNKQQLATRNKDTVEQIGWIDGKVIYSPDSCLRIGQIAGRLNGMNTTLFFTTVQCLHQNKILELKLVEDTVNYVFQDYPIMHIYKLPKPKATYLILSAKIEGPSNSTSSFQNDFPFKYPADKDLLGIEKIYNIASIVHIAGDSLLTKGLVTDPDDPDSQISSVISGNSLCFDSYGKTVKQAPKPFLKYNQAKKELSFSTTYCGETGDEGGCNISYVNVYSGTLAYRDTAFTLVSDTSYLYPSLKSLTRTITNEEFKTGNCITRLIATEKYEEIGDGVVKMLDVNYKIGSQNIGYVNYNYMLDEAAAVRDLKPEYKVQKDSSLIFLITDSTFPNDGGQCGRCQFDDSRFWLIRQNSKKLLFSFSSNSGSSYTTYSYNNGRSGRSGRFYVKNNSSEEDISVAKTYWKNNSTYVVQVSDENLVRNFYINFVTINKKTIATLVAGKLEHRKGG